MESIARYIHGSEDSTELIMLVGIPGSGKSTVSTKYAERGYKVHSSDLIRKELYGMEEIQGNAAEVFQLLEKRTRNDLKAGKSCVIDATNLTRKRRAAMLRSLSKNAERKTCIIVLASPMVCIERNAARNRMVPPEVIYRMLCTYEMPYYYEGWDAIEAVFSGEPYAFPRKDAAEFSQDNPFHTLSLGEHLDAARDYCKEHGFPETVCEAAWFHDVGKLYTKRFMNHRGEPTETAHFYGHENYSAYLYLCEKASQESTETASEEALYIANLINWHMRPLNSWNHSSASREKDRDLMGESMYRDVMLLNEADIEAH